MAPNMRRKAGAERSIPAGLPYFPLMPATADNEKKRREKMAKLVSITAATALVFAAIFPAVYTFVAFA